MKQLIRKLFQTGFEKESLGRPQMSVDLATAVLLVEVSRADFDQDDSELENIRRLLLDKLAVDPDAIDDLIDSAHHEADQLVSIQHITRMMNERMSQQDKVRAIELMWLVAYADGEKHHYEEHLLRQVADLLYVSHEDFIRARHQAEEGADRA